MARHAQPREVAEVKGALRVHPERYRKTPPKAAFALGPAPEHLRESAKAVWFELDTYAAAGVLTCADRLLLELAANLVADYREAPSEYPANKIGHIIGCLARLGMSPADRQKLTTAKAEEVNAFDAF